MIIPEPGAPERARVIGSLSHDSVRVLENAVNGGVRVLDLSQVNQVDDHGARALARLLERCRLLSAPRWLELWIARVRRDGGG
jgi:ABC-type transporter Mla MlaB component